MPNRGISSGAAKSAALLFLIAAPAGAYLALHAKTPSAEAHTLELVTAGGVRAIDIEVATTPEQQALGLMYRTELADNHGMLFPYEGERELSMWMHNTYIPLDMVFIRADGTVARIEVKAAPLSDRVIRSGEPVTGVLELAGGAAERLGLKPGDKVRHPHFTQAPVTQAPAAQEPAK